MQTIQQRREEIEQKLSHTHGRNRITLLHKLATVYLPSSPENALPPAEEAFALSLELNDPYSIARSLMVLSDCRYHANDVSAAQTLISQAKTLASSFEHQTFIVEILMRESALYHAQSRNIEAIQALEEAGRLGKDDIFYSTQIATHLGSKYLEIGWHEKASEALFRALSFLETDSELQQNSHRTLMLTMCLSALGDLYGATGDLDLSFRYTQQSLDLCHSILYVRGMISALLTLGSIERSWKKYDDALKHYYEALQLVEENHERQLYATHLFTNIADIFITLKQYKEAGEYISRAFATLNEEEPIFKPRATGAWFCHATLLIAQEAYTEAEESLMKALFYAEDNAPHWQSQIYLQLAEVCERTGDMEKSYSWYKRHVQLQEHLLGSMVQQTISRIYIQYELRKAEAESALLHKETTSLKQEAEQSRGAIAHMAFNLIQKNEGLVKLRATILDQKGKFQNEQYHFLQKLTRSIDEHLTSENDMVYFEQQFNRTHADFLTTLSRHIPHLTPTELRICMLLKLNLSSKDMARVMNISIHTIHTHRRRIRKKLQMKEDASLTSLLLSL